MPEMCVLDETGHTRTIWDPNNDAEVEAARASFNALKKKGYLAYKVNQAGDQGEVMTEFDPTVGKMIMAPAMRGG